MRKNIVLIILAFSLFNAADVAAQETEDRSLEITEAVPGKNLIKVNLTSLALNNYSLQYERAVARKISVGMGVRFMPESTIPFKSFVKGLTKSDDVDDDITEQIDNFRLGNFHLLLRCVSIWEKKFSGDFILHLLRGMLHLM